MATALKSQETVRVMISFISEKTTKESIQIITFFKGTNSV